MNSKLFVKVLYRIPWFGEVNWLIMNHWLNIISVIHLIIIILLLELPGDRLMIFVCGELTA